MLADPFAILANFKSTAAVVVGSTADRGDWKTLRIHAQPIDHALGCDGCSRFRTVFPSTGN